MDNPTEFQIIQDGEGDSWNEIPDQIKQAIQHAKNEIDSGLGIPHAAVMAEVKARFLNR
jgi:hypothetical protein